MLWDFYSSVAIGGFRFQWSLEDQITLAKQLFPFRTPTQFNLTVSHKSRLWINRAYNDRDAAWHRDTAIRVKKSTRPSPNEAQDFWLFPGLLLIAYVPQGQKKGIHNGQLFEVLEANDVCVPLRDVESKEELELPFEFLRDYLRLAYAFTNVGCQGRSLGNFAEDGVPERGLTIWDTDSPYFTLAHLFTGTSRCRSGALLQVV